MKILIDDAWLFWFVDSFVLVLYFVLICWFVFFKVVCWFKNSIRKESIAGFASARFAVTCTA